MSYIGRGGEKLAWALAHFRVDVSGLVCCDLGSNVGGFVDALLQAGAARVYSVDTSYGTLDWNLRNDERVVVMERTNALHVSLPEKVDLVTCDVGWTRQARVLPAATQLIKASGRILSLLKPQYEAHKAEIIPGKGRVRPEALPHIIARVSGAVVAAGLCPQGPVQTPFRGGKGGNPEYFMLLECQAAQS